MTSCKDTEGITIGLIDTIINCCRLLKERDLNTFEIKEGLKDLGQDKDLKFILSQCRLVLEEN